MNYFLIYLTKIEIGNLGELKILPRFLVTKLDLYIINFCV